MVVTSLLPVLKFSAETEVVALGAPRPAAWARVALVAAPT